MSGYQSRRRWTPDDLVVVRRIDGPPDLWATMSNRYHQEAPADFVEGVIRPQNVERLAHGLIDIVEQGYVVIGPHQHREWREYGCHPFLDQMAISDRVRVVSLDDLAYVKRDWCGRHFEAPFEDEPDWTTVGVPAGHR